MRVVLAGHAEDTGEDVVGEGGETVAAGFALKKKATSEELLACSSREKTHRRHSRYSKAGKSCVKKEGNSVEVEPPNR